MRTFLYFLGLAWIFTFFTEGETRLRIVFFTGAIWVVLTLYEILNSGPLFLIIINALDGILWTVLAIKESRRL